VLRDNKATRQNLESFATKHHPDIFFLNGHGSDYQVAGYNNEIILDYNNVITVAGANVYALACNSAAKLGSQAMQCGAKGYIGYNKEFILLSNSSKTAHSKDEMAELFLQPSNIIVQSLCKGSSADEAAQRGRQAFRASLRTAMNSDIQSDNDKLVPYLFSDMRCLTSCAPN